MQNTSTNKKQKICLYARVSTGNQGTGLEAQIRALKQYCSNNNITDNFILPR